jgi:acetyltransferase-like isoleucine patch superfamily enzyme
VKAFLRFIKYFVIGVHDAVIGRNLAVWKRLEKAGRVSQGAYTYGIPIVKHYIHDTTKLTVGSYSCMAENSIVMLGGQHAVDHVTTFPLRIQLQLPGAGLDGMPTATGDSVIGSDVWMGQRAFLRSGITVGHGAIIASCAVVTKDVPPFAIVGGNPARVIKYRHTEEQRAALLEISWWDWPDAEVRRAAPLIAGNDIDAFIAYGRARFPQGPTGPIAEVEAPYDPFA